MIHGLFNILATLVTVYTFACLIRVLLTWIPNANNSPFGQFLSKICDPYLDVFKKMKFLRFGMLDLSAAIGICVLWGISYIFSTLALGEKITGGYILALIVSMVWSAAASLLGFFIIFLLIRLIVLLVSRSTYGTIWDAVDRSISPIIFSMTSMFYKGRAVSFKGSLVIAIVECAVLYFLGSFLIEKMLVPLLTSLPF